MQYAQFQPVAPLAQFVQCFWIMSDDNPAACAEPEHVVPDGCMEMIVHVGNPFFVRRPGGGFQQSPRSLVAGQITSCLRMCPTGPFWMIGARFEPHGARRFFDLPMHEIVDAIVPLSSLIGSQAGSLAARIGEAPSARERLEILQSALLDRLAAAGPSDDRVDQCVGRLIAAGGRISIDELCRQTSIGTRQLERRFRAVVGIPPKLLARIIRFRRIFEFTETGSPVNWLSAALACGYYDQAHLIRDFQDLAGRSPTRFLAMEEGIGKRLACSELPSMRSIF